RCPPGTNIVLHLSHRVWRLRLQLRPVPVRPIPDPRNLPDGPGDRRMADPTGSRMRAERELGHSVELSAELRDLPPDLLHSQLHEPYPKLPLILLAKPKSPR